MKFFLAGGLGAAIGCAIMFIGDLSTYSKNFVLSKYTWECIAIKPATEVGQKAECVAYRSTEVEWSR